MYEKYFGLSQKPFNATPDPWFHYSNRAYQEAYATLLYGIQERKGFVALIGEVGTGKTTLLRRFMDNRNPAIKAVFVHNSMLTFDELVEFICAELEISVSGVARLARLQALNRFLITEAKAGGTVVLLLDEAQNLSAEALENLRLISNLETATDKLLQIVLAGQPELEAKLADPGLRQLTQRIALRYRLEPLDDSEVEPYVDYRLRIVGRSRRELFTDKAIRRLIPYVHGIPRLINILCDNALVLAYATERQRVTAQMVDIVAADLRLTTPRPLVARRSATPDAPGRPERGAATLWDREASGAHGHRWAVAGFAVGGAIPLLVLAVVGLGGPLDVTGRLSSIGVLADWALAPGRPPTTTTGTTPTPASAAPASTSPGDAAPERPIPAPTPVLADSVDVGTSASPPAATRSDSRESAAAPAMEPGAPSSVRPPTGDRARGGAGIGKTAGRTITVPRGGTISGIAFEYYGRYSSLALDLIQELNPDIDDLDVVATGQPLWLPPLNLESLLRRQADGSYRLVVSSQPSFPAAASVAQAVRDHGFAAKVVTRAIASEQMLYRVEINSLTTRAAAVRAWETAKRLEWFDLRPQISDARSLPPRTGPSWQR